MTAASSRAALDRGIAALRANNLTGAETALREALRSGEPAAEASFYLTAVLRGLNRYDEAAAMARESFAISPLIETAYLGGELAALRLDGAEALFWADQLQHVKAKHLPRVVRAGEQFTGVALYKAAARCFEIAAALAPDDIDLVRRQCYCEAIHDRSKAIRVLRAFAERHRDAPHLACLALYVLLPYQEKSLREQRGLPPDGRDPSELHFKLPQTDFQAWADATARWLAASPQSIDAIQMMAMVRIAEGRARDAEPYLERVREQRVSLAACAHFDEAFLAEAASASLRLGENLPAMEMLVERAPRGPWVFMACDAIYFEKFGRAFARSFALHTPAAHLHLHVFDLPEADRGLFRARLADAMGDTAYSVSLEMSGFAGTKDAATYYHAVRFIRLAALADAWPHALCAFDADMIFNRSPDLLFDWFKEADVGVALLTGRVEPSNQICANVLGIAPTQAGRNYLRLTAGYLALARERGILLWGMDQTAMFAVLDDMTRRGDAPRMIGVPSSVYEGAYAPEAIVWVGKGAPDDPNYAAFAARQKSLLAGFPPAAE